jgi:hypothetical protein
MPGEEYLLAQDYLIQDNHRVASGGIFYPYTFCFSIDIANEQVYS